jgi:hypothetical protein
MHSNAAPAALYSTLRSQHPPPPRPVGLETRPIRMAGAANGHTCKATMHRAPAGRSTLRSQHPDPTSLPLASCPPRQSLSPARIAGLWPTDRQACCPTDVTNPNNPALLRFYRWNKSQKHRFPRSYDRAAFIAHRGTASDQRVGFERLGYSVYMLKTQVWTVWRRCGRCGRFVDGWGGEVHGSARERI